MKNIYIVFCKSHCRVIAVLFKSVKRYYLVFLSKFQIIFILLLISASALTLPIPNVFVGVFTEMKIKSAS